MKFILILLIIIFILFLVLLIPAKLKVKASLENFDLKVSVLGIEIPIKKEKKDQQGKKKKSFKNFFKERSLSGKLSTVFNVLNQILNKVKFMLKRSKVEKFELDITVSGDDAAVTAIEYGAVCAVVYPAVSLILNYNKALKENINIVCDYTNTKPTLEFYGVVSIRLIHLLALLSILPSIFRNVNKKENKNV